MSLGKAAFAFGLGKQNRQLEGKGCENQVPHQKDLGRHFCHHLWADQAQAGKVTCRSRAAVRGRANGDLLPALPLYCPSTGCLKNYKTVNMDFSFQVLAMFPSCLVRLLGRSPHCSSTHKTVAKNQGEFSKNK